MLESKKRKSRKDKSRKSFDVKFWHMENAVTLLAKRDDEELVDFGVVEN